MTRYADRPYCHTCGTRYCPCTAPPDAPPARPRPVCPECRTSWCDRLHRAIPGSGLTPPPCEPRTGRGEQRRAG